MSRFFLAALLVLLVVCVSSISSVSAATSSIQFFTDTACANSYYNNTGITVNNANTATGGNSSCQGVNGVSAVQSLQLYCIQTTTAGTYLGAVYVYPASGSCSATTGGVNMGPLSANGGCTNVQIFGVGSIQGAKVVCANSAFSTQTVSLALMIIMAILAMISM